MKRFVILFVLFWGLSCEKDVDLLKTVLLSPSKVELTFPEKNSECTTGNIISDSESEVTFEWTDADVGDLYEIHLKDLSSGQETRFESDSSSMNITLLRGTPYQWRVSTILNDSQEATDSDTEAFYNSGPGVHSFVPFPAAAASPKNGENVEISTGSITLEWEANDLDNDILNFDVYFGTQNPPVLLVPELNSSTLSDVSIEEGEEYYWKITTRDVQNNESNSQVFSFTVN